VKDREGWINFRTAQIERRLTCSDLIILPMAVVSREMRTLHAVQPICNQAMNRTVRPLSICQWCLWIICDT